MAVHTWFIWDQRKHCLLMLQIPPAVVSEHFFISRYSLEPQTTSSKWMFGPMFGETNISYIKIWFIIQLKQPFINGWPWGSRSLWRTLDKLNPRDSKSSQNNSVVRSCLAFSNQPPCWFSLEMANDAQVEDCIYRLCCAGFEYHPLLET